MKDDEKGSEKYRAPALTKGLDILELLASSEQGLTQVEIAKQLGRTTSEIFRMLVVLRQRGYAELGSDERYRITMRLFEVANRHPMLKRLTAIAGPAMQTLANTINQCIHLTILNMDKLLVIAQVDGPDVSLVTTRLGAQLPLANSPSTTILAAYMNDEELASLFSMIAAETGDGQAGDQILAELPEVAKQGFCQGPSRILAGVTTLSAPIFDYRGNAVAAVTVPFVHRLGGRETMPVDEARAHLVAVCRDLSRRMGAGAKIDDIYGTD
ncbi:IclR family transcriptional regulator [Paracoccus versutus]|uniref:IclR family transcriptional regulator n=1 Tax=Paracoccus versutus TaxID=34007 RepID=A0A3D9Y274_PARVE|nr:IclR family transcriptional regulator [Paracoccus versutus]REF73279.1 IclR family transcriptional regulator [Paracoccus versutus]WGR54695.1 IclR family transcriptional regulator [Paracoccus versutus]